MSTTVTNRTDTKVTFTITVEAGALQHAADHAYDRFRPQVKVSGFRPGKAPNNIVAREVGEQSIQSEALEHAVGHAYSDAVFQEKLVVVGQPDIKVKKSVPYTDLEFEAVVEIVPPVTLPDYKKITKSMPTATVEDTKVDEVIEDLRRRTAKRVPALRTAEMGDEVKFDFKGTRDGAPVEGASGTNYTLKLGSGNFIPGFEEELVGLKVEDKKTFTITFPKDYHESTLAGQPVEFAIVMHEVTALELPDVTDEFAATVGPFTAVDELRTDVRDQLTAEAKEATKRQYEAELLDDIIGKSDMKVPDKLVAQQVERLKGEMSQRLAQSGLTMEQYLSAQKQSQEEFEKTLKPEAEKRVKLAMILSEVAKAEGLSIGEEEVEAELVQLRTRYTDPQMQKELASDKIREDVYNHLMSTKVVNKLIEYAQT